MNETVYGLAVRDSGGYHGPMSYADQVLLAELYPDHVSTLTERHDRALERAGASHVVIFAGAPRYAFLDDNDYPFRPNPHFISWLPLTKAPLSYIIYTPGERTAARVLPAAGLLAFSAGTTPTDSGPGTSTYASSTARTRLLQHLPENRERCILIGEIHEESHAEGIERINPGTALNILHYARARKTPYEAGMHACGIQARRGRTYRR